MGMCRAGSPCCGAQGTCKVRGPCPSLPVLFLHCSSFPPSFCPNPYLSFPSHSFFKFSFLFFFQFFFFPSSSPLFSKYLNVPPEGPAGPPEERGPRHVPFVPLWGSGTGDVVPNFSFRRESTDTRIIEGEQDQKSMEITKR